MAARPLCRLHAEASGVWPARPGLSPFGAIVGPFPFLDSPSISQQEILDDTLAFATRKRSATGTAGWPPVDGFRTGFDFDDLIKRIAVRTVESRPACRIEPRDWRDAPNRSRGLIEPSRQTSVYWRIPMAQICNDLQPPAAGAAFRLRLKFKLM